MLSTQKYTEPSVALADVFRMHGKSYRERHTLTSEQHKVMNAVINCRTAVLGGHVMECDNCEAIKIAYNSCRNRHCPKCQSLRTVKWLEDRRKELLPVQYFHMVFTLPHELNHLILYNKAQLYNILFQSAWEALDTLGQSPKRLDGKMGMIGVLHTWGQNLTSHNHLHCIVPGGALTNSGTWNAAKPDYLFSVKVISKIFQGIYVSKLRRLYQNKQLTFPDTLKEHEFTPLLNTLMEKDWVVYSKKPFEGPEKLLDYLGRYTHKIAISNNRILSCDDKGVTFKWRDYSDDNNVKEMTLSPDEFIRRYLSHVVPKGFQRIRFYGFLGNASKKKNIEKIRQALHYTASTAKDKNTGAEDDREIKTIIKELTGIDISICNVCKKGHLRIIEEIPSQLNSGAFLKEKLKLGELLFDSS